jgi:hypothetical protein
MRLILLVLTLMSVLAYTASAEPVTFAYIGRVTLVSGAPSVVDAFLELGVVADAPVHGEYSFESTTPSSPDSPGRYKGAILQSRLRIGGWSVQGPTNAGIANSIGVTRTSYGIAVAVGDEPDVIPSERSTTTLSMTFFGAAPPAFENTELPVEPPDLSLFEFESARVLGGGGAAGRVQVAFDVETLIRVPDRLEEILGVQIRRRSVVFQVTSSGCTRAADFEVEVFEAPVLLVALIRTRPDLCRVFEPLGKRVRFSYRELGLEPGDEFVVINPRARALVPDRRGR